MKNFPYILLFFFLLSNQIDLIGQNTEVQTEKRTFKDEQWQKVTKSVDYHKPQKRSILEQEIKKIGYEDNIEHTKLKPKEEDSKNRNFNFDWSGLRYLGIALLVIIGALLVYFFVINSNWKMDKKLDDLHSVLAEIEENLPEADVETPLERAKREKNYKVAIRLYYLLLLQKLSDKKYIKWSKEKTNRNYITELRANNFIEEFRGVTILYEKAWFGKDDVHSTEFENIEPFFINLIQKIVQA